MLALRRSTAVGRRLGFLRPTVPVIALLGLFATLAEGIGVALMVPLLSLLLGGSLPQGGATAWLTGPLASGRGIPALILLIFAFLSLRSLIAATIGWLIAWLDSLVGHRLRVALADRLLAVDYRFLLAEEPGQLVNIVSGETWRASDAIRHYLNGAASLAAIGAFGLLMAWIEWRLLGIVIVGAFAIRLLETRLVRRTARQSEAVKQVNARLADHVLTIVLAMRAIRLFGRQGFEHERLADRSDALRQSSFAVWASGNSVAPVTEILHTLLLVVIVLVAVAPASGMALPVVAGFLILLQRMQPHLRVLEQSRVQFAAASAGLNAVEDLLQRTTSSPAPTGTDAAPQLAEAIRFDDVGFRYGLDGPYELEGLSFTIPAGATVALVGASGSGKSTIVNLLCRLLVPSRGTILVDGTPLDTVDPDAWRAHVAIAGQDIDLVDGTIAENIAYGSVDATASAIADAARRADATEFIDRLPQGLATPVGNRGLFLSGGQRQRISLARAFVRRPRLLILDEATSAIDGLSEEVILERLHADPTAPTILVISHRPSTLARCTHVIRLAQGRLLSIAEAGATDHQPLPTAS